MRGRVSSEPYWYSSEAILIWKMRILKRHFGESGDPLVFSRTALKMTLCPDTKERETG